jgi:hypothetical protein
MAMTVLGALLFAFGWFLTPFEDGRPCGSDSKTYHLKYAPAGSGVAFSAGTGSGRASRKSSKGQ